MHDHDGNIANHLDSSSNSLDLTFLLMMLATFTSSFHLPNPKHLRPMRNLGGDDRDVAAGVG